MKNWLRKNGVELVLGVGLTLFLINYFTDQDYEMYMISIPLMVFGFIMLYRRHFWSRSYAYESSKSFLESLSEADDGEDELYEDAKEAVIESYVSKMRVVSEQEKTIYDHVVYDSEVESHFANELEVRDEVEFYMKLPPKFKIETPLGMYNPDWAIVFKNDKRLYLVVETKGKDRLDELSISEQLKIACGEKHFSAVGKVQFVAPVKDLKSLEDRVG